MGSATEPVKAAVQSLLCLWRSLVMSEKIIMMSSGLSWPELGDYCDKCVTETLHYKFGVRAV